MNDERDEIAKPQKPEDVAKIVLWADGDVTIEWPYIVRDSLPIERSEAVTAAAKKAREGWNPA